jgi:hypothetical protein
MRRKSEESQSPAGYQALCTGAVGTKPGHQGGFRQLTGEMEQLAKVEIPRDVLTCSTRRLSTAHFPGNVHRVVCGDSRNRPDERHQVTLS